MVTQVDIAKDWGVSRQYVNQCVKRGCPLTSIEEAREWKLMNASIRLKDAMMMHSEQNREARLMQEIAGSESPPEEWNDLSLTDEGDPMGVSLKKAQKVQAESYRLVCIAQAAKDDVSIGARLGAFNKSTTVVFDASERYRKEMERRGMLIALPVAKDIARKSFETILSRLQAFPQSLAARCNPSNPLHARDILQKEVITILEDARKAYAL